MDMSSAWPSQLEMQDQRFKNQYHMIKPYHLVSDFNVDSISSESNNTNPSFIDQAFHIPTSIKEKTDIDKFPCYKTTNSVINKFTPTDENPKPKPNSLPDIPNTFIISFGDQNPKDEVIPINDSFSNATDKKGPTMSRNRIQLQDHMLAERKRREKLARRFISLSSLLPGLKKIDKATVLEDAANYIQELQCRIKELEGLSYLKRKNVRSDTFAKRSKLSCNDDNGPSFDEENFGGSCSPSNPEIEVRMLRSSVLVRIYCQKNCLSLVKVISEIQKLGFSVTSSSAFRFDNATLLITIVAKKKDDCLMTSTDLVKNLQLANEISWWE